MYAAGRIIRNIARIIRGRILFQSDAYDRHGRHVDCENAFVHARALELLKCDFFGLPEVIVVID